MKKIICKLIVFLCFCLLNSHSIAFAHSPSIPPHILVIFGATGDLTSRKLMPALQQLAEKEQLPEQFAIIGIGRKEMSDDQFRMQFGPQDDLAWETFRKKIFYLSGTFENDETYAKLSELCTLLESQLQTKGNRLYYLATPADSFAPILEKINMHGLADGKGTSPEKWSRVIIEKPFGHDLSSAINLQMDISHYLDDTQVYLIDHYLGKEVVHQLLPFRFTNTILEDLWNNQFIDHVDITLSEDIGVGTRGNFWEKTGLLRDLVQNHAVQLLSLVAMEEPKDFTADSIREEKAKLVSAIRPIPLEQIDDYITRGQYARGFSQGEEVPGYREEIGVAEDSFVETFVEAKLYIDNDRWMGVPFYIKAGKRLAKKFTEIVITFTSSDQLVFRIQPEEEIYFLVNDHKLTLPFSPSNTRPFPEAYERLFQEAMLGNSEHFVSYEELLASWRLFTPVLHYWQEHPPLDFPNYEAGSEGPQGNIVR